MKRMEFDSFRHQKVFPQCALVIAQIQRIQIVDDHIANTVVDANSCYAIQLVS